MFTLKHIILILTKLLAREVYPPYINVNPTLLIPKCIQTDTGDTIIPGNSITCDITPRIIALELTVDYKRHPFVVIDSIPRDFDLQNTEVKLKKYMKKSSPTEKYDQNKHRPIYVDLPESIDSLCGFKLWIDPNIRNESKGRIERGTQFISIFSPPENEIKTKKDLNSMITQFKYLLEIWDDEPTDYSFCFEIKIFLNNFVNRGLPESFVIYSKYFNFEVTDEGYSMNLNYVSKDDYHIV